jgi:hypothetical protein
VRAVRVSIEIVDINDDVTVAREIQSCSVLSIRVEAIEIGEVGFMESHRQIDNWRRKEGSANPDSEKIYYHNDN